MISSKDDLVDEEEEHVDVHLQYENDLNPAQSNESICQQIIFVNDSKSKFSSSNGSRFKPKSNSSSYQSSQNIKNCSDYENNSVNSRIIQKMLRNKEDNIEKIKVRAENGNVQAQTTLANWYYDGVCVEKDWEQSFKWNEKAAANKSKVAMYNLGWLYYNGEGVKQDKAKGIELFRLTGEMGYKKGSILAEELSK